MENLLIVNADDFGLSKGQNYGIIEACRRGVVTSTTALINGEAVEHAAQLSRELPELGVGMHFVLTLGLPLSPMPGLTRDGQLGKWIWEMAEQDALPLDEIARELDCQFNRFVDVFGREPTHIDSHHHVHMIPEIFPLVAEFAQRKGVAMRVDREVMAHPAFVDNIVRKSAYCWPRLAELDVLTSASLKYAIAERGYRLGTFRDL